MNAVYNIYNRENINDLIVLTAVNLNLKECNWCMRGKHFF
jgi:hypothetical protein